MHVNSFCCHTALVKSFSFLLMSITCYAGRFDSSFAFEIRPLLILYPLSSSRPWNILWLGDEIFIFKYFDFELPLMSQSRNIFFSLLVPFVCPNDRPISWFLSDIDASTLTRFSFIFLFLFLASFSFGSYLRMRDYKEKMCF